MSRATATPQLLITREKKNLTNSTQSLPVIIALLFCYHIRPWQLVTTTTYWILTQYWLWHKILCRSRSVSPTSHVQYSSVLVICSIRKFFTTIVSNWSNTLRSRRFVYITWMWISKKILPTQRFVYFPCSQYMYDVDKHKYEQRNQAMG